MRSSCTLPKTCVLVAIASAALLSLICAERARADDIVHAVWKRQEVSFAYRGAAHTCRGLRAQLRSILRALGAQEATTVSTGNCDDAALAREVHVVIASPVEATPENILALTPSDATAQLAARLRGERLGGPLPTFPARWKTISFANALHLRLSPADCELLRQLRREVMPKLSVRVLHDRMRCESDLGSGRRPQLVVAALVEAPAVAGVN